MQPPIDHVNVTIMDSYLKADNTTGTYPSNNVTTNATTVNSCVGNFVAWDGYTTVEALVGAGKRNYCQCFC